MGVVDFTHLIPLCGRDALYEDVKDDAVGCMASACEVYAGEVRVNASTADFSDAPTLTKRFAVIQVRSDACVGARRAFCEEYVDFILALTRASSGAIGNGSSDAKSKSTTMPRVVLMSSLPSTYAASEAHIGGTKLRRTRGDEGFQEMCERAEVCAFETLVAVPSSSTLAVASDAFGAEIKEKEDARIRADPHWAMMVALDAVDVEQRVGCLLALCSEGDNALDGAVMALAVARACDVCVPRNHYSANGGSGEYATYIGPWRVPRSWEGAFGLRGASRDVYT